MRDRRHFYGEISFKDLKDGDVGLYKDVIDAVVSAPGVGLWAFVADRDQADPIERFGSTWDAYAKLAEQLCVGALKPDELMAVMADNYSAPDHVLFEQELRANVNRRRRQLSIVSVVRLDSKSSDGLQVADLFVSAIAHEFRASAGLASSDNHKAVVSAHVRQRLGVRSCLQGWRDADHSVQLYDHGSYSASASNA